MFHNKFPTDSLARGALSRWATHSSARQLVTGHLVWAQIGTVRGLQACGMVPDHYECYPGQGTRQHEE